MFNVSVIEQSYTTILFIIMIQPQIKINIKYN